MGTATVDQSPAQPPESAPASSGAIPSRERGSRWWIVPAVLVGLVVLAWLVVAGMPFGTSDKPPATPQVDTVAEAPASAPSATIVEVPGDEDRGGTVPSVTTEPAIPSEGSSPPRPSAPETRKATTRTRDQQPIPPATSPARAEVQREISPSDAEGILRNYVTSTDYYRVKGECIRINNRGYKNVGYTLEIWNTCEPGGASRMLGSWRVDAKTREVFRRRDDGRYLRP